MNGDSATTTGHAVDAGEAAPPIDAAVEHSRVSLGRGAVAWETLEQLLVRAGDWLNPILVKETRQALKSFQFTITFVLVLVACWMVTIGGVSYIGPRIYYSADGGTLLMWYFGVLAFPLTVVVPYAAYRSLVAEREDNTYELLSITSLMPRQIISGKLGSSIVQMTVYFSVIMPCVAFTYLLRGVDLPMIATLLAYTFFHSLGLSMIAILLATLSQQRFTQVFVSVALVAFLLFMFWISIAVGMQTIQYNFMYWSGNSFWVLVAALATFYITTFALAFFAAAGMITFTSENRSTPLRICMLVQQAAFIGWLAAAWIGEDFILEPIGILAMLAAAYWYVMGTLLSAERPEMSQRVKRRLPQSFLARLFLSWLNPGPATGYMFVVANASFVVVLCLLALAVSTLGGKAPGSWLGGYTLVQLLIVGWGYVVGFLGLGMLVVGLLRRVAEVTMLANVLIHFLVLLALTGIPTAIHMMSIETRDLDYSLLQITNPFWSLDYLAEGGPPAEAHILMIFVPATAICILLLNLRGVLRELREVRIAPPPRVVEDEAALHPAPAPQPTNPWDEPA